MKKFFFGLKNYGTQAGILAKALRKKSVMATAITEPDSYQRQTDFALFTGHSYIGKIFVYGVVNPLIKAYCAFRYDTFVFFFGQSFLSNNFDLPVLKFIGKKIYFVYLGWDVQQAVYSIKRYQFTNASEYKNVSLDELACQDKKKKRQLEYHRKYANKLFVCAPYLCEFVPDGELLPLAIDVQGIKAHVRAFGADGSLRIAHAPTHTGNKGTKFIERAIATLQDEGYDFEYERLQGLSHARLLEKYGEIDIFIDQVLTGWYGTASIEAMAHGCSTVCYLRDEYREYCPYFDEIPIINANPETITNILRSVLDGGIDLQSVSCKSVEFVKAVHSSDRIATKLIDSFKRS